jgi:hypothetical protein
VSHSHGSPDGGHYDGGNHPGTGDGGGGNGSHHGSTNGRGGNGNGHNDGSHSGNNDQNSKHSVDSNKNNNDKNIRRCIPVTLSDLPGQTQPLELCLVIGLDTNVSTEIGNATLTLSQSSGGEFKLIINGLNGQTQPAIITTKSGVRTPIIVPGLGTGNVLIGVFIH